MTLHVNFLFYFIVILCASWTLWFRNCKFSIWKGQSGWRFFFCIYMWAPVKINQGGFVLKAAVREILKWLFGYISANIIYLWSVSKSFSDYVWLWCKLERIIRRNIFEEFKDAESVRVRSWSRLVEKGSQLETIGEAPLEWGRVSEEELSKSVVFRFIYHYLHSLSKWVDAFLSFYSSRFEASMKKLVARNFCLMKLSRCFG